MVRRPRPVRAPRIGSFLGLEQNTDVIKSKPRREDTEALLERLRALGRQAIDEADIADSEQLYGRHALRGGEEPPHIAWITNAVPIWLERFLDNAHDYGWAPYDLGTKGLWPDVNRKISKLRKVIWDGQVLHGEQPDEIAEDLIGHMFLLFYALKTGGFDNAATDTDDGPGTDAGEDISPDSDARRNDQPDLFSFQTTSNTDH